MNRKYLRYVDDALADLEREVSELEQAEINRFGMWDEEIFTDIIEKLDDDLPCWVDDCSNTVAWRVSTRCCGETVLLCANHGPKVIARMREKLTVSRVPICMTCRQTFPRGSTLEDVARVIAL